MGPRKIRFLAFFSSVVLHLSFLFVPFFSHLVFPKAFKVVDVVPLNFDLKVDADVLGERSLKGYKGSIPSGSSFELPKGKSSKSNLALLKGATSGKKEGDLKERFYSVKRGNLQAFRERNGVAGKGDYKLAVSPIIDLKDGKDRSLAVRKSKIVPYLLLLKDRIMDNWVPPYFNGNGRNVVVIDLTVLKSGEIGEMNIVSLSKSIAFNRAAVNAVYRAEPFPPFPSIMKDVREVKLRVRFEVN